MSAVRLCHLVLLRGKCVLCPLTTPGLVIPKVPVDPIRKGLSLRRCGPWKLEATRERDQGQDALTASSPVRNVERNMIEPVPYSMVCRAGFNSEFLDRSDLPAFMRRGRSAAIPVSE